MYPGDAFTVYRNGEFLSFGAIQESGEICMTSHPNSPAVNVLETLATKIHQSPSLQSTEVEIEGDNFLIEGRSPHEDE